MKNKKLFLGLTLVFVLVMGSAVVLYDRLGQSVATEQMIVHEQPAAQSETAADPAAADQPQDQPPEEERIPAPDFAVYDASGNEIDTYGETILDNYYK